MSVPDEGYSRNVPDEGYSRNVPDEGYSSNVPDEGYSRNASCALMSISTLLLLFTQEHIIFSYCCKSDINISTFECSSDIPKVCYFHRK